MTGLAGSGLRPRALPGPTRRATGRAAGRVTPVANPQPFSVAGRDALITNDRLRGVLPTSPTENICTDLVALRRALGVLNRSSMERTTAVTSSACASARRVCWRWPASLAATSKALCQWLETGPKVRHGRPTTESMLAPGRDPQDIVVAAGVGVPLRQPSSTSLSPVRPRADSFRGAIVGELGERLTARDPVFR